MKKILEYNKFFEMINNDGFYYKIRTDSEIVVVISIIKICKLTFEIKNKLDISFFNDFVGIENNLKIPGRLDWILNSKKGIYIVFDNKEKRYYFVDNIKKYLYKSNKDLENKGIIKINDDEIEFYKNLKKYNL